MKQKLEKRKTTVEAAISDACTDLEDLKDELQEWYDNLPESFQYGSKGEQLQEAIDGLSNISEPSVDKKYEGLPVGYMENTKAKSRAARRDNAVSMLDAARTVLEDLDTDEAHELAEEIQQVIDDAESVEFPGMYS